MPRGKFDSTNEKHFPDLGGSEMPVAFASRLNAQIDKEALSIVWGVKRCHLYLCGRRFTLVTDHKPLIAIFHPEKGVPAMTAARLCMLVST